eukprot:PLAT13292.1.p1 GENE.PLAT13292.1~~PLAT13292.1.p1  ORF type:complete len:182 (-),score=46.19 PLAT13292.1:122-667(-)
MSCSRGRTQARQAGDTGAPAQLLVDVAGRTIVLAVDLKAPVSQLKRDLAARTGISPCQQALLCGVKPLRDEQRLCEAGVRSGARVELSQRVRGGQFDVTTIIGLMIIIAVVVYVVKLILTAAIKMAMWLWDNVLEWPVMACHNGITLPIVAFFREMLSMTTDGCYSCGHKVRRWCNPYERI